MEKFKIKVRSNRIFEFWKTTDQLIASIALSLPKTIKSYPAIGWVRGNELSGEAARQINKLREESEEYKVIIEKYKNYQVTSSDEYASGNDPFTINCLFIEEFDKKFKESLQTTWDAIFNFIVPYIKVKGGKDNIANYLAVFVYQTSRIISLKNINQLLVHYRNLM